ncbi:HAD-IA family hydrolase [Chitinilyticum piscinae]|uniref:HAD-IA family hydrolase n=1 Tax=Chitinilyticum piscinae TaxID=2866724 RepID=A0A8J7FQ23_9NEIS|nr:HAD-IA family hydrolase [Chitinilyticum piscinae]MBE9608556.1 HAD-IA family hydrolase [Chitinilyticum piscinae]
MSKRFDLLVFDWDGTLMDSTATITYAIRQAFEDIGLPVPTEREARYVIGYGLTEAMQHLAPRADDGQIRKVVDAYRHYYLARDQQLVLFDGVREALVQFAEAGFTLCVATGKSRAGLDRVLEATGLGAHFLATRTADEAFSKPHPAMLEYLIDFAGVEPERTLMIGDTTHDLQLAINAGTHSAALTYGAHDTDALAALQPLGIFDDFPALTEWILAHG